MFVYVYEFGKGFCNPSIIAVFSRKFLQDYHDIKNSTTTIGMHLRSSISPTQPGYGSTMKNTSTFFKTPTSVAKTATKRTRLPVYGASKILRPMIN